MLVNLHSDVTILLSTVYDGSLRKSATPEALADGDNAATFLAKHDLHPAQTTLRPLTYDTDDFCKYHEVATDEIGAGFAQPQLRFADSLMVRTPGVALFLPIADCIGTVLYHSQTHMLMLSHLGRHNLEQQGGMESVRYMQDLGAKPEEIIVYLSPAASGEHYPLYALGNKSLHQVAAEQLQAAGISPVNITTDARDTVTNPDFFSHSAYLRGEKPAGRHAIACYLNSLSR